MPREIAWLPAATQDLIRLRNFIKSSNPIAAKRAATRIIDGIKILQTNPKAGIPVEGFDGFYDLLLSFGAGNYIIRYREDDHKRLVIVRVRHSREERLD